MKNTEKQEALAEALRQAREAGLHLGEAARKIWLAGLGALAKANAGGGDLFSKLIEQGVEFESATRRNAREQFRETRENVNDALKKASVRGKESWSKVETAVIEQIQRSLDKLGVAGQSDVADLNRRVDEIARKVRQAAAPAAKPARVKKAVAAKPSASASAKPEAKTATKTTPSTKKSTPAKTSAKSTPATKATAKSAARKVSGKKATPSAAASATATVADRRAATKKAGATIAAARAAAKSTAPATPRVARRRDEIADIAAELESAQLAAHPRRRK